MPKTRDRGLKKIETARILASSFTRKSTSSSRSSSSSSPSSPLPWWKKYFGCFSRRCRSENSSPRTTRGGGKYKRIKKGTKRYKKNNT